VLRVGGSLRNPAFLKVWTGQSISMTGSQVSVLAMPLIAAVLLHASSFEMGLLRAVSFVPVLVLGLPAGAWLDTVSRRPVMIAADLGRAALLLLLPVAALAGTLRIEYLYAVAFLTGGLSLVFDVAQSAWLPGLIRSDRDGLLDANSKLELSRWSVQIAGPGLATALVQFAGATLALIADSVSFVVSAIFLSRVHSPEPGPTHARPGSSIWRGIPAGLHMVLREPLLRTMAGTAALSNLFAYAQGAVLLLFVTRELALPPTVYGAIVAGFGVGGVCGSLLAPRVAGEIGRRGAICAGVVLMAAGDALVAASGGPVSFAGVGVVAGQLMTGLGLPLCTISMVSLRQSITPVDLLGRVNATTRLLAWGAVPLGALLGGALGDAIGLRPTLVVSAAGSALVVAWVLLALAAPAARFRTA
jgi:MFS family permease